MGFQQRLLKLCFDHLPHIVIVASLSVLRIVTNLCHQCWSVFPSEPHLFLRAVVVLALSSTDAIKVRINSFHSKFYLDSWLSYSLSCFNYIFAFSGSLHLINWINVYGQVCLNFVITVNACFIDVGPNPLNHVFLQFEVICLRMIHCETKVGRPIRIFYLSRIEFAVRYAWILKIRSLVL